MKSNNDKENKKKKELSMSLLNFDYEKQKKNILKFISIGFFRINFKVHKKEIFAFFFFFVYAYETIFLRSLKNNVI